MTCADNKYNKSRRHLETSPNPSQCLRSGDQALCGDIGSGHNVETIFMNSHRYTTIQNKNNIYIKIIGLVYNKQHAYSVSIISISKNISQNEMRQQNHFGVDLNI